MPRKNWSSEQARKRVIRELARIAAELATLETDIHRLWFEDRRSELGDEFGDSSTDDQSDE